MALPAIAATVGKVAKSAVKSGAKKGKKQGKDESE